MAAYQPLICSDPNHTQVTHVKAQGQRKHLEVHTKQNKELQ
jgi:hypothetical protein